MADKVEITFIDELKEVLDKRNNQLFWDCKRIYFLADLITFTSEDNEEVEDERDLSTFDEHYMFLEPCNVDFHVHDSPKMLFGLAEYLYKENYGLDRYEVPLISYKTTDDNKCLFTCFIRKDISPDDKVTYSVNGTVEEITVRESLKRYLDGQISDGWGGNGVFLYYFIGCNGLVAFPENLRAVKPKGMLDDKEFIEIE